MSAGLSLGWSFAAAALGSWACCCWPPAVSGVGWSVVVTNLKTSKESGFSAEAAVRPKKFPTGSLILGDSKQGLPSTVTLKVSEVWRRVIRDGLPRFR